MAQQRLASNLQDPLKEQLRAKSRQRRDRIARSGPVSTAIRNDLLPLLELIDIPIDQIRPPARNVRRVVQAHVDEVARSITHFGCCAPVIVGRDNVVLNGWVRCVAAKRVGLSTLPCIRVDHLSQAEQRQLRLALNRLGEKGEWALDELKIEFCELIELGEPLVTGFDPDEIDFTVLADDAGDVEHIDLQPAPGTMAVAQTGDMFLLGRHRLICGDATSSKVIERVMAGIGEVRLVLTDEPYNVKIGGHVTSGPHREFTMASGEMSDEEFLAFNTACMDAVLPHLIDGGVFGTFIDWRGLLTVHAAASALALSPLNLIVWSKTNAGMGSLYRSQHELLPLFRKGTAPIVNNVGLGKKGRWRSNVWVYPGASSLGSDARQGLKDHPTVKPTALLQDALLDLTNRGDVVLDPFLGSGSTLIAAQHCGRVCCGVELDPLYVDVICRRYHTVTGKPAIQGETGLTFDELANQRGADTAEEQHVDAPALLHGPDPSAT